MDVSQPRALCRPCQKLARELSASARGRAGVCCGNLRCSHTLCISEILLGGSQRAGTVPPCAAGFPWRARQELQVRRLFWSVFEALLRAALPRDAVGQCSNPGRAAVGNRRVGHMLSAGGTLMGVRLLNCSILPEVFEKKLLKAVYTQLYQIYPRELKSYVNTRPCCSPAASCSLSL